MRTIVRSGLLLSWALLLPALAAAQSHSAESSRVYVSADGTWRAVYDPFQEHITYLEFAETTKLTADYTVKRKPTYSVGGSVRVWRAIAVGVSVTAVQSATHAEIDADVPHPFFFDQPRHISGTADSTARRERAINLEARAIVPIRSRFDVTLFGGPSRWHVEQELLEGVDYTQQYPYDTAQFAGARTSLRSVDAWGYNGGIDFAVYLTPRIGVGGLIEISTAKLPLTITGGESFDANVGGLRSGIGFRARF